jgi:hypothetical protein
MGKSLRYAIEINTPSKAEEHLNQKEKFVEAAYRLGCDSEPAFDDEKAAKLAPPERDAEEPELAGRAKK